MSKDMMEVQIEGGGKKKLICDGILCSIARAISRQANVDELIDAVVREFDQNEICESWKLYFTVFNDVICKSRKKPIIDIVRTEVRLCAGDIVTHLKSFEKNEGLDFLVMPWNSTINPLKCDSEILAEKMTDTNAKNVHDKIAEMEQRIDDKNKAYFESLQTEMRTLIAGISKPSYAAVSQPPPQYQQGLFPPPQLGVRGRQGRPGAGGVLGRERSSSANKRPRVEDVETSTPLQDNPGVMNRNQSRAQSRQRFHTGTLNTSEVTGRKMRSPPADIFIYGVHKETTEQDIVDDLKESDILIDIKDVVKKSKPEAGLNSFKISVKAQDLQKALDPAIWPMRVKVREYIYFKKKPDQFNRGTAGHSAGNDGGGPQHLPGTGGRDQVVATHNRFEVLGRGGPKLNL